MSKNSKPSAEAKQYAKELAELLGETELVPAKQISRVVNICGLDFAREIYNATVEIEDKGGMMLPDNSRRRTKGGVFFYLVRTRAEEKQREIIFPHYKNYQAGKQKAPLGVPLFTWDERIGIIQSLQTEKGEIKSMKVSLTGRPGAVEKRSEVVVTTMSYQAIAPSMPRGIPTPPTTPTLYTIYMAPKQWERIEDSLADPADIMMVDGVCAFDTETNSMAVFASSVRSEFVDAKIREEQRAASLAAKPPKAPAAPKPAKVATDGATSAPKAAKPAAPAQPPPKSGKKSRYDDIETEPLAAAPAVSLNPNLPPEISRKLTELYASASLFRQKVATLQGKPAGQQFGLEMTQKLLKNVEDEIAGLEKKYNN